MHEQLRVRPAGQLLAGYLIPGPVMGEQQYMPVAEMPPQHAQQRQAMSHVQAQEHVVKDEQTRVG
ncbi:MAG: hypothetical protein M5U12_32715 [Verrucomicrobia bacterium]|nr:hypothetical protein [Verrucomicrobiota bacterium]